MAGKRQRAPEPPAALLEQLRSGRVVPFIGAGFSKSAQAKSSSSLKTFVGMPTYAELLTRLLELARLRNADDEEVVRNYIRRKDAADPEHYDKAAAVLREAMGEVPFFMTLREVLEPFDRNIEGSLAHKFLGRLGFRRVVTVNYDRLLEGFSFPDHEVITPRDEKAFALFMEDPQRNYILKLHGDITRPDTIPWGKAELLRYYGYDSLGNPLPVIPPATQKLRDFLRELFTRETVLFLGTSLSTSEGFAQVLANLVRDWGGSLPRRHFVLVPYDESLASLRSELERKMNLHYLYYYPDEKHTQVWEFISFLKAGRAEARPRPGEEFEQWYLQKERPDYLQVQLERERTATSVHYLTPKLTNAIAQPEFLATDCREELEDRYDAAVIARILEAMQQRAANLERRLREERLEVRVLFLERELRQSLDPESSDRDRLGRSIERYRHLLRLVESTDLEVRVIGDLGSEELKRREACFALIFNRNEDESVADVTVAYSSQATNDFPEIHMLHVNSPEVWRHTFTFERFWAAARNEEESKALIAAAIEGALGGG